MRRAGSREIYWKPAMVAKKDENGMTLSKESRRTSGSERFGGHLGAIIAIGTLIGTGTVQRRLEQGSEQLLRRVYTGVPSHPDRTFVRGGKGARLAGVILPDARCPAVRSFRQRPDLVAKALQDWLAERGAQTTYITQGSPSENPYYRKPQ